MFAREVWSETVRLSARAILDTAFGEHVREDKLVHAVCAGDGTLGLARISVSPTIPVVAVGGPVGVYYGEVGRRLGCQIVFPEYGDVANAIGAATGVVAQTVTVRVAGDGSGLFVLHSTVGTRQFDRSGSRHRRPPWSWRASRPPTRWWPWARAIRRCAS